MRTRSTTSRASSTPSAERDVVVDLSGYLGRRARRERARARVEKDLDEVAALIVNSAFAVACAGPWKEWDASMAPGAQAEVTVTDLRDVDDELVKAVVGTLETVFAALETVTSGRLTAAALSNASWTMNKTRGRANGVNGSVPAEERSAPRVEVANGGRPRGPLGRTE